MKKKKIDRTKILDKLLKKLNEGETFKCWHCNKETKEEDGKYISESFLTGGLSTTSFKQIRICNECCHEKIRERSLGTQQDKPYRNTYTYTWAPDSVTVTGAASSSAIIPNYHRT